MSGGQIEMSEGERATELTTILSMLQLGDSFFPTGLYTLSHGLETLVQTAQVASAGDLEAFIEDYVTGANGPAAAVAAAAALRAALAEDHLTIVEIDRRLKALKLAHEAAVASVRTGRRLLRLAHDLSPSPALHRYVDALADGEAPGNYAVALGVLGAGWGPGSGAGGARRALFVRVRPARRLTASDAHRSHADAA